MFAQLLCGYSDGEAWWCGQVQRLMVWKFFSQCNVYAVGVKVRSNACADCMMHLNDWCFSMTVPGFIVWHTLVWCGVLLCQT